MSNMHQTTERLYLATKELRDVSGQSAVARLLGVVPQVVKNWETRGLSEGGALLAQKIIGCDANWLLTGSPTMRHEAWAPPVAAAVQDTSPGYTVTRLPAKSNPLPRITAEDWLALTPQELGEIEGYILGYITAAKVRTRARPGSSTG